ncbi:MAG: hypothetical protein AAB805_00020 [Patescibacteria group bacterium]
METLFTVIQILHQMGVTFGVGASTFALTFFINALEDGTIDSSERRFLHIVYVVLRIGMTLITLSLLSFGVAALFSGANISALFSPLYLAKLTLIGVIIVNAILMTYHKMPMKFGPVLAGGSWYSLFFVTAFPFAGLAYSALLLYYGAFLVVFFIVFIAVKNYFVISTAR